MRLSTYIIIVFLASILAGSASAQFQSPFQLHTCAISTGHGLLQDFDCDRVPDQADNCPEIQNPRQEDSNRDGIGDVCAELYGVPVEDEEQQEKKRENAEKEGISDAVVKVIEVQDIHADGPGAVYPIKITNNARNPRRFVLEVMGVGFGTYRIDPSPMLIIGSGSTQTAYLHVLADPEAEEGQKSLVLKVSANGESEQVTLLANILAKEKAARDFGEILGWVIVAVIVLVLLAIIARDLQRRKGPGRKLDKDIYSYY